MLPFRPHQRVWWRCLQSNGLEVAMDKAFNGPCLALEKLNGTYAAMGKVSRWPLVHVELCITIPDAEECGPIRTWDSPAERRIYGQCLDSLDASQTIFPPTNVVMTLTSRIFAGAMVRTSSLSKTMSASLPGVIEPLSFS